MMKSKGIKTIMGVIVVLGLSIAGLRAGGDPAARSGARRMAHTIGKPGESVDPARHAVRGKITVVDFSSDYCGACALIAPQLDRLVQARTDIVVLTVNVNRPGVQGIDWSSPVLRQHGIESLPYFQVYDRDGRKRVEGEEAHRVVLGWLRALPAERAERDGSEPATRRPRPDPGQTGRAGS